MSIERRNIEHLLWRKKVDYSIFTDKVTAIPKSYVSFWKLEKHFPDDNGILRKENILSNVKIIFDKKEYIGNVDVILPKKRASKEHRLWFPSELVEELKQVFVMSHMRWIERELRKPYFKNPGKETKQLEREIPFWEFLDIEFDEENKIFYLAAHYVQEPTFRELFKNISGTPKFKQIEDSILGKEGIRIYKQDWKNISELETEIGASNVVYTLLDEKNKKLYIGESKELIPRLKSHIKNYSKWTHYRYDVLPLGTTTKERVAIEKMLIRSYATILKNKRSITTMNISDYELFNEKIDK